MPITHTRLPSFKLRYIRKAHFATRGGDTVVAVLGAAHLNGVKRLLTSSRVV